MLKQHDHQIRSTNAVHIQYECRFMERGHNITYIVDYSLTGILFLNMSVFQGNSMALSTGLCCSLLSGRIKSSE